MATTTRTLSDSLVSDLRAAVSGDVIVPGDETYDEARALWNGRIDRHPAAVVRVASTDDVAAAIRFAREQGREIAVRGGGHHVTGSAVVDDGIVIDCSNLTDVDLDPDARTVRVGTGCRVGDVLSVTQEHGLAIACGSAAHNASPDRPSPAPSAGSAASTASASTASARSRSSPSTARS
jgi:FAD/FMN-containing dehydrogenase